MSRRSPAGEGSGARGQPTLSGASVGSSRLKVKTWSTTDVGSAKRIVTAAPASALRTNVHGQVRRLCCRRGIERRRRRCGASQRKNASRSVSLLEASADYFAANVRGPANASGEFGCAFGGVGEMAASTSTRAHRFERTASITHLISAPRKLLIILTPFFVQKS
jgi:hypothetical protein